MERQRENNTKRNGEMGVRGSALASERSEERNNNTDGFPRGSHDLG